jgi:hypothetical protein
MRPILVQRVENAAIAVVVLIAFAASDLGWWWLLVLFLAFDLSALGYLAGPRLGATAYNAVHNYTAPALLTTLWLLLERAGTDLSWMAVVAGSWAFHVAVDRALGYGLKHPDGFGHTHLGPIGKLRREGGQQPR